MTSIPAHLAVWLMRWRVKRRLKGVRDHHVARRILRPDPYRVPSGVRITAARVGGVSGEWVEGPHSSGITLLYLHGGGYFGCSAESHRPITVSFALHGFRVFAPEYRLAPENPFPAAVEDAGAAYRGLLAEGIQPKGLVVSGDSAGGGLSLSLLLAIRAAATPLPAAAVLFSPWTDLAATGESIHANARRCAVFNGQDIGPTAQWYLGNTDPRNPLASPLYADLRGLPPLLLHVGADEVLLDDSTRLAERALAAGVPVELKMWPVVPHAWQLAPHVIPEARRSLREASEFLRSHASTAETDRSKLAHA